MTMTSPYSILGLLILEKYGPDFTTADVGAYWKDYLPYACTAEHVALENLKAGVSAEKAGEVNNPYQQWIGADIRSDPWGWACAGNPEKAAEYAWRDAYLSHRRNGIYGEMFFAAAQAAAFSVDSPEEAIRIGLTEIPTECTLAKVVEWALEKAPEVKNWEDAREAGGRALCRHERGSHQQQRLPDHLRTDLRKQGLYQDHRRGHRHGP